MTTPLAPVEILLVEDNPTDILLTVEALKSAKLVNNLHTVPDGVEAMEFLRRQGKHAGAPRPGLILLDLNMPRKDGREVLRDIKSDEDLNSIPVVILTTSTSEKDILESYGLHANSYIVKPVDFDKFTEVVKEIQDYWFSVVTLARKLP